MKRNNTLWIGIFSGLLAISVGACVIVDEGNADNDGDGYDASVDCNDNSAAINPAATELCHDGIDNDCDGKIDNFDSSCPSSNGGGGSGAGGSTGGGGVGGVGGGSTGGGGVGGGVGGAPSGGGNGGG